MEIKDAWIVRAISYTIPAILIFLMANDYLQDYLLIVGIYYYIDGIETLIDEIDSSIDK